MMGLEKEGVQCKKINGYNGYIQDRGDRGG